MSVPLSEVKCMSLSIGSLIHNWQCIHRWHDAIRTLAKLHRVDTKSVGLESFGKASGFYNRQIATFGRITDAQAKTKDLETGEEVGQIERVDDMLSFFRDPKTQPKDRGQLIHGDFKIDNLVFHKTEPRVIGILEWASFQAISSKKEEFWKTDTWS